MKPESVLKQQKSDKHLMRIYDISSNNVKASNRPNYWWTKKIFLRWTKQIDSSASF